MINHKRDCTHPATQAARAACRRRAGAVEPTQPGTVVETNPAPEGLAQLGPAANAYAHMLLRELATLSNDKDRYHLLAWLADRNTAAVLAALKDQVVVQARQQGMTYAQVAAHLTISQDAVNQAVSRHNRRLRALTSGGSNA